MSNVLRVHMSTEVRNNQYLSYTFACEINPLMLKLLLVGVIQEKRLLGKNNKCVKDVREGGRKKKNVKEAEKEYDGKIRCWRKRRSKVKQMSEQLAQEMG